MHQKKFYFRCLGADGLNPKKDSSATKGRGGFLLASAGCKQFLLMHRACLAGPVLGSSQCQMSSGYLSYVELKAASFPQDIC